MLKIKNNTDLKELEKFGFDLRASCQVGTHDWNDNFVDDNYGYIIKGNIYIFDANYLSKKYLRIIEGEFDDDDLDTLYDLIQAGLV